MMIVFVECVLVCLCVCMWLACASGWFYLGVVRLRNICVFGAFMPYIWPTIVQLRLESRDACAVGVRLLRWGWMENRRFGRHNWIFDCQ